MRAAVLYCTSGTVYRSLDVDCWDVHRDARNYRGWLPVVAHPPCRMWGRLRHLAHGSRDEYLLGIHAVAQVRRCGGVLEHPAGSLLWSAPELGRYQLPAVGSPVSDEFGGFSVSVYQGDFGHVAPKHSWLYIVPASRAGELCESLRCGEHCNASPDCDLFARPGEWGKAIRAGELCEGARPGAFGKGRVMNQPAARRLDTPLPFARLLVNLAVECGADA